MSSRARGVLLACTLGLLVIGADCGPPRRPEIRQGSKSYLFNITSDPIPPHARENVIYTVTVRDRESGQPIETGEGRMFANSKDGASTNDGFTKEKEVGTYSAKLFFPVTGDWAMALQFRREKDPHMPLERIDWIQAVVEPSPPGK